MFWVQELGEVVKF